MVAIKNTTTGIDAARTVVEVQGYLASKGVRRFQIEYDEQGVPSALAFEISTEHGPEAFSLPARIDGILAVIKRKGSGVAPGKQTREQAARIAWRLIKEWVEVQVSMIDAGLATLDEVFFPYQRAVDGRTIYEVYAERQMLAFTDHTNGRSER